MDAYQTIQDLEGNFYVTKMPLLWKILVQAV